MTSPENHVALIIERMDIALGGAERSIHELAQALRRQGWQVDLLAATGPHSAPHTTILCPQASGQRVSFDHFGTALRQHLQTRSYDLVHSVLPFPFADVYQPRGGTYAETLVRHITSFPSAFTRAIKRATAFTNRRRTHLLAAERQLVHTPDGPHIAALSHYVARQFMAHYGCPEERITIIRNGVAPSSSNTGVEFKHGEPPVTLLFAAHNFRLKGLRECIDALALARHQADLKLLVAGHGPAQSYQSQVKRLGVGPSVHFLGPLSEITTLLPTCDVAILPTYYDPASRFILEALMSGKPVITSSFNGAIDHFQAPRHGLIVTSPRNIQGLAEAMVHLSCPKTRQAMHTAILQDRLADHIHIDRAARELIGLYEFIKSKKGRPSC